MIQFLSIRGIYSNVKWRMLLLTIITTSVSVSLVVCKLRNLLLQNKILILIDQIDLLIFDHCQKVVFNITTSSKSIIDILSKCWSNIFVKPCENLLFDAADDLQQWSLSKDPSQSTSCFYAALFDALVQDLIIKFAWRAFSNLVRKFTSLSFNYVTFTRCDTVGLRVFSCLKGILDFLFMSCCRVFVVNQSLCWRPVLSLWSRHVVAIKDAVYSCCSYKWTETSRASVNHLVHQFLKFVLHIFSLLLQVLVSHLAASSFLIVDALDLLDVPLWIVILMIINLFQASLGD